MVQIVFDLDELMERVVEMLQYTAGKRATSADDYHRLSACEADRPMLIRFVSESLWWLASKVPGIWGGSSVEKDRVSIQFNVGEAVEAKLNRSGEFRCLVGDTLVYRILYLWLRLAGGDNLTDRGVLAEEMASVISSVVRLRSPLKTRRSFPYGNF